MPGTDALPTTVRRKLVGHKGPLHCVRFNEKGSYCVTAGQDRTVKLWNPFRSDAEDMSKGFLVQTYTGPHGYEIKDVAVSTDNSRFVSVGADKTFFLWDVGGNRVVRKFWGHTSAINSVALNEEATVVVTGSYDRTIRVWDLRSNNRDPIQILSDFRDSVTRVRLTRDEILATSVDGTFRAFDVRTGMVNIDDCNEALCSLSLSNDGKCVLLSGLDGVIRLMEKDSGGLLNTYKGHTHTGYPVESCFNNSDAYVLTGSEEGTVHIYDLVEGKEVKKLKEHSRAVCSLAYHPSDACVITAGYDGVALVWSQKGDD